MKTKQHHLPYILTLITALLLLTTTHAKANHTNGCTPTTQHGRTTHTLPPSTTTATITIPIQPPCTPPTILITTGSSVPIPIHANTPQRPHHGQLRILITLPTPQPGPTEIQIGWAALQ